MLQLLVRASPALESHRIQAPPNEITNGCTTIFADPLSHKGLKPTRSSWFSKASPVLYARRAANRSLKSSTIDIVNGMVEPSCRKPRVDSYPSKHRFNYAWLATLGIMQAHVTDWRNPPDDALESAP